VLFCNMAACFSAWDDVKEDSDNEKARKSSWGSKMRVKRVDWTNDSNGECAEFYLRTKEQGGKEIKTSYKGPSDMRIMQDGKRAKVDFEIRATGGGSNTYSYFGSTSANHRDREGVKAYKIHFGLVLEQWGDWIVTDHTTKKVCKGKFLVFEHFGKWLRISVASTKETAVALLSSAYGDEHPLKIHCIHVVGKSSAACWRFMGAKFLNTSINRTYCKMYTQSGGTFFGDGKTNCLRFGSDIWMLLMLDFDVADAILKSGDVDKDKQAELMWEQLSNNADFQKNILLVMDWWLEIMEYGKKHKKLKKTFDQMEEQWKDVTGGIGISATLTAMNIATKSPVAMATLKLGLSAVTTMRSWFK